MIITDDISRLERLDRKYGKLTDSPEDVEKRKRLEEKMIEVREGIVSELDERKERIAQHQANYLARNPDGDDSPKIQDWNRRLEHIDKKIQDIDSIIDPSLIAPETSSSSSNAAQRSSSSSDEETVSVLDSNE